MPTKTKTTKKRAVKKRPSTRAAADSDVEEKTTTTRRKAVKKTTRKTTKSRSANVTTDDDFGGGLLEDDAPAKKTVKKKRKVAKKATSSSRKTADDVDDVEKKPAAKKRKSAKKKKAAEPTDDFGAELDFDGGRSSKAERSDSESHDTDDKKPRRGRRSRSSDESNSRSDEEISFDSGDAADTAEAGSKERSDGGGSNSGTSTESRDSDGEGGRRGRRRRGRRGRGRRGGRGEGDERTPSAGPRNQRNKRGRDRERTPARDIEPVSTHVVGVLELHPKGYGFVRSRENDYAAQETDPFVSTAFIERYALREGVLIEGEVGPGHRGQGPRLTSIATVEGKDPEEYVNVKDFDRLTPINPEEMVKLEMGKSPITTRVIDLLCPIGKGQRALIVAPPRSGKTILLQQMADAVAFNHPECHLMVMLIDERPEEVTEMRRHVKGEVVASSIDRDLENHVRISQLVIERAKRLAEQGKDVFILLDSITRLARAFNKYTNTGRTGSGGIDVRAMDKPKKIFGSARVFDEGGSITVVGTALIQTGSRMDDVIFEEFKGTGNMELVLSRELADRRIWPAMDIEKSGTRREEKLLDPETLEGVTMMRRSLVSLHPVEAMEQLIKTLSKFDTNAEFLSRIRSVM